MKEYEIVMGLEVHVELATNSKLFCSCSAKFGADANEHVCPACAGMPGMLPITNKKAVELGIAASIVTNSEITPVISFDKKNYFYPDLSCGYQITQLFNEKSKGEYTVLEGSLYPVLFRLVDAGYLSEYEQLVGVKRKRRYYHLEEAGKVYYRELLEEFDGIIYAINSILDRTIDYSQNYA